MAVLDSLIDKQDTFEIVRDQIGSILALEVANQKALATTAEEDPALWDLEIFLERANNWEKFLNDASEVPIVNVVFNSLNIDDSASVRSDRQKADGLYNIYCYAYGLSQDDDIGGGHIAGDRLAYFELHRTIRLVRNILMASQNTYLQLQGTVIERRIDAIEVFDPTFAENPVQNVVAARIGLRVLFNEFTPQSTPETLELLSVDVKRTEDGQIIAEADYDYT